MAIPLLCVVFVLVLLWLCVFLPVFALLFLVCFLVCFLAGTASGLRTGPLLWLSTSWQPWLQFNCLPRLNVCNDLAEAMKALDGKKSFVCGCGPPYALFFLDRLECCLDVWDVLPRVLLLCVWHIRQQSRAGKKFGNPLAWFLHIYRDLPGAMGRVARIGSVIAQKSVPEILLGVLLLVGDIARLALLCNSSHLCQSRRANRLGLQVCSNVVVLNSFSHIFESDTVVKPLCPLANLFCGCFCLGSGPFCVSGLLFLLTKRKSGWGICGSSGWLVGCFGLVWFAFISGPVAVLVQIAFYCLCSCKGPSHRAKSATLEGKKKSVLAHLCVMRAASCTSCMVEPYWLTMALGYLHARIAARLVFGPSSAWFLAAVARMSLASSSGDRVGSVLAEGAAWVISLTGASLVRGRLLGIGTLGPFHLWFHTCLTTLVVTRHCRCWQLKCYLVPAIVVPWQL